MTTEQEKGERDKLVSETYRDLGVEKAPEHLNQNILRMAAADGKVGRSNSFLSGAWMKPVAWAATIGLSLAIVLELTDVPTTVVPMDSAPAVQSASEASVAEDFIAKDKQALERAEEQVRQQSGSIQQETPADALVQDPSAAVRENKLARRPAASVAISESAPAPGLMLEDRAMADADVASKDVKKESAANTPPEPVIDQPVRRKVAADQVVTRERITGFAMSSAAFESELDRFCDPEARKSADDWLACIEDLRASGATEQADLEYEAYILEYPAESGANK
jgi:hypothetical protein